ncbi:MAG: hypothetical protein AB7L90_00760 [Hyphomicrobiaceae bacterium]
MVSPSRPGILIVSPPGPLGAWIYDVVGSLAKHSGVGVRHIDRNEKLAAVPDAVHLCQYPSLSAIQAIEAGLLLPVAIICDPLDTAARLVAAKMSLLEAIRALTGSMVGHLAIGRTSRSRLIFAQLDVAGSVIERRIAQALQLPSERQPAAHGETLHEILDRKTAGAHKVAFDDEQARIIEQTTGALLAFAEGSTDKPLIWPIDVLFSGDRPNQVAPRVAHVTGPSRIMLYGPYLHLPPSRYDVEIIIAFSGLIEDIPFLFEVHAGDTCLAQYRIAGRPTGGYRGRLQFEVSDPVAPVEIRLRNEQGSIEGEVALVELRLSPVQSEISRS